MEAPKVVVFDLGKVLLDFDFSIFARDLARNARVDAEEVLNLVVQSDVLIEYETGRTTSAAFYRQVSELTGYSGDAASFEQCFGNIFTELPEMIATQQELKSAGIPTYIFSNTNEIAIKVIRDLYPFFGGFDAYVYSYQEQSMKPDSKIYEVVEKVTGHRGSDLVFIDDKPENIEQARQRGWHGIVHRGADITRAELRQLGLPLGLG